MTYTTKQIREFCDAFDRGELERKDAWNRWVKIDRDLDLHYALSHSHEYVLDSIRITPKPTPPVYEQWTDIKEVPLEHWYKSKTTLSIGRITSISEVDGLVCIINCWRRLENVYEGFLHSPDPFAPDNEWMVCGRVKG